MRSISQHLFFIVTFCIFFGLQGCSPKPDSEPRIPGEFEPHDAIWIGFRTVETQRDTLSPADSLSLIIIKEISDVISTKVVIENDTLIEEPKQLFTEFGIDTSRVEIVYQSPTDVWYRDPGPLFGLTGDELFVADFKYGGYSNPVHKDSIRDWVREHERIDKDIAERWDIPTITSNIAIEGGALESNGKGVVILTEDLTLGRNPGMTKSEIESDLLSNYGVETVIWLPDGLADDPLNWEWIGENFFGYGAGGHTDEYVRFVNESTILLAWVNEEEAEQHIIHKLNRERMTAAYEVLSKSVDTNGQPFNIIKVPTPEPVLDLEIVDTSYWSAQYAAQFGLTHGDTAYVASASSYLNFGMTNGIILLPQYGDAIPTDAVLKKDTQVLDIFESAFPDRRIVTLNPMPFNSGGGGIHCRYQHQPSSSRTR